MQLAKARSRRCGHVTQPPGGTINRMMEHLNPRGARIVALEKPSPTEQVCLAIARQRLLSAASRLLAGPVVLPALLSYAADQGRDCVLRSLLVQPCRR
jgi:hypothetical protein